MDPLIPPAPDQPDDEPHAKRRWPSLSQHRAPASPAPVAGEAASAAEPPPTVYLRPNRFDLPEEPPASLAPPASAEPARPRAPAVPPPVIPPSLMSQASAPASTAPQPVARTAVAQLFARLESCVPPASASSMPELFQRLLQY
ncbi:hypothetical protein PIGHUM_02753 [Pigmentiphaga humi]|uniref:Uncharacterized protein n=1 Tax=Pigmentiphaga humi TaxID=2478468 RepID=A0A3P4B308_9BURK|nr:hypothetical protein [Pigmentiphaga humi]VCU70677.1 hypothetical protein PIGHUM_02753 [Pigmentiphaga humi]